MKVKVYTLKMRQQWGKTNGVELTRLIDFLDQLYILRPFLRFARQD